MKETKTKTNNIQYIKDIASISMMTAIIAVCSWITIPTSAVSFTMQTFGVFAALRLLGGKKGTISVLLYIFIGAIGVPVFAGFSSGPQAIVGPTGGYIIGFLFICALYWVCEKKITNRFIAYAVLTAGLFLCYTFGTVQFIHVTSVNSVKAALLMCVVPFIIPDLIKLVLADLIGVRVKKALKL